MIFGFLNKPVLDEESVQWLFAVYGWALRNFDAKVFYEETRLVLPNNAFFPGQENSVEGMANLIFGQVAGYAGLQHWPFQVVEQSACGTITTPKIALTGPVRGEQAALPQLAEGAQQLIVPYDASLVRSPEALIASYAHSLAHYLGSTAQEPLPGGAENWPHAMEVLAVFLGFGLMFANSAFNVRMGCGGCQGPAAQRPVFLSQYDITYALAIFCALKDIPNREVLGNLKSALRPFFKKAVKEVRRRDELPGLQAMKG